MDSPIPRILILVENLSVPFDRRVWQEARALTEAGYRVEVICPRGTNQDTEPFAEIEGVRINRYALNAATGGPAGYLREYGTALWRTLRIARRLSRDEPFDVVHACNPPDLLFLIALALRPSGARFLFDHHDLVPELFESRFAGRWRELRRVLVLLERLTFRTADAVISTNESYRQAAIGRGKMPPDRVRLVRSAPDLSRFVPVEPDPSLKRGKPFLACYLGVMGPQDGVDYALRALAQLHGPMGRDDLHTTFLGSGDAFDEVVALTRHLGLEGVVEFTGRVPDETVQRYLSTADVCLSPDPKNPLNDVSSMNKVVEYMAMGRPLVSFDLHEAQVTAQDAAVYALDNDEVQFAKLIAELLDDPDRRERMGRIGRERVEQALSWELSRHNLLGAYEDLLVLPPRRKEGRRRGRAWLRVAGTSGDLAGQPSVGNYELAASTPTRKSGAQMGNAGSVRSSMPN
jgi:glycosyltransferase involved in cell wall biosynthesis